MAKTIIKCPNCGHFNTDKAYCENCNELISHSKKRELREKEVEKIEIEREIFKIENPGLAIRLKNHPNFFYKIAGWILYSIISVVSLIGAGLAWIVAMAAAG